jgi:hypothetical protein
VQWIWIGYAKHNDWGFTGKLIFVTFHSSECDNVALADETTERLVLEQISVFRNVLLTGSDPLDAAQLTDVFGTCELQQAELTSRILILLLDNSC